MSPFQASLAGLADVFVVKISPADFTISASASTATVTAGQSTSYTLSVSPVSGFDKTVSLSCSGAPKMATCTVSPLTVTLSGSSPSTVTVNVTTTARSMAYPTSRFGPPGNIIWSERIKIWLIVGLILMAIVPGLMVPRNRRVLWGLIAGLLLVVVWTSCGGGGGPVSGNTGTPPGTYKLTVTATYTAGQNTLKHDTKLTLTVN